MFNVSFHFLDHFYFLPFLIFIYLKIKVYFISSSNGFYCIFLKFSFFLLITKRETGDDEYTIINLTGDDDDDDDE